MKMLSKPHETNRITISKNFSCILFLILTQPQKNTTFQTVAFLTQSNCWKIFNTAFKSYKLVWFYLSFFLACLVTLCFHFMKKCEQFSKASPFAFHGKFKGHMGLEQIG